MNSNLRPIAFAAALLLASAALTAQAQEVRRPYIVQLQDVPAAAYTGGTNGMPATQPAPGLTTPIRTCRTTCATLPTSRPASLPPWATPPCWPPTTLCSTVLPPC